ncbi:MAG: hypothetical protein AB7N76_00290 [Planctomycetota bacterium]
MAHRSSTLLRASATLLLALLVAGCPQAPQAPASGGGGGAAPSAGGAGGGGGDGAEASGAIKVKTGDGKVSFRIKPAEGGWKISDEATKELYRVKLEGQKVKVKDPQDKVVAYVNTDGTKFKVEDPDTRQELFVLRPQADGDYKLETAQDELVCKLKRRDYGWEAKDPSEAELFKAKLKEGKSSVRDAQDRTLHSTKDPVKLVAFACLGLPRLSEPQRLGLLLLVEKTVK